MHRAFPELLALKVSTSQGRPPKTSGVASYAAFACATGARLQVDESYKGTEACQKGRSDIGQKKP